MSKWRLPAIKELQNAFDLKRNRPKIDGFVSDYYWSSTANANDTGNVVITYFGYGYTGYNYESYIGYVRCVRKNSKGKLEWSKPSTEKVDLEGAYKYCRKMNEK